MRDQRNHLAEARAWLDSADYDLTRSDEDGRTLASVEMAKVHALIEIAEQLAELNRSIRSAKRGVSVVIERGH